MPTTYLPTAEGELAGWATRFGQTLSASPALYGVSAEEAAHYVTLAAAFAQSVDDCDPTRRTQLLTLIKQRHRNALLAETRRIVKIVDGQRDVTPDQRVALGLKPPVTRTRRGAPVEKPNIFIQSVSGLTVNLVIGGRPGGTAKPDNVIGVILFCAVGESSGGLHELPFAGTFSRNVIEYTFDTSYPPGTPVCFAARWLSRTLKAGPLGPVAMTHLLGGLGKSMPPQKSAA